MFTNNYAGMNPQDYGRMGDSMLVHMNPREVAGLQSLARSQGTSMTVNPQTGYPEAFNLKSLLPMIAGAALTPVLGPAAPLVVGGLGALMTGSVEQGLMMGLGAYGGAGLATGLAGSAANLAAPAMAAAPTAAIAAPSAMGTTGIMASGAPATTLAGATQFAPAASVGGVGFQASPLPPITEATTATAGSTFIPKTTEAAGLAGSAMGSTGVSAITPPSFIPDIGTASQANVPFATAESIADVIPSKASSSLPKPTGLSRFFQSDDNVTYENIGTGLKNVFSSGENAMDFLGDNKMNLAMSAAPMLITPEQQEEEERRRAMIRPYGYEVDNLSGTAVDPFGTEAERLRGRFVAKEPYYAAKGGLMSLAEGGSTSGSSTTTTTAPATTAPATTAPAAQIPSSLLINLTPAEAEVYRNIFAVQQMAGVPLSMPSSSSGLAALPSGFIMSPMTSSPARSTASFTPSMVSTTPESFTPSMVSTTPVLDTSEKRYNVFDPIAAQKEAQKLKEINKPFFEPFRPTIFQRMQASKGTPFRLGPGIGTYDEYMSGMADTYYNPTYGSAKGGLIKNNESSSKDKRKKVSRSDPFYEFGLDMTKIAEEQFANGGMTGGYSYDPISNSYRMMARGGLTSLKAGGLREGAFIVPADVISHLGNGSSEAGMRIVQERLKGRPIKGPGDGMSDSIPTNIAGKQPARVANEEAEIPPEVVAALGGGSLERGAKKLYEMMDKIRKDRTGKKKQAPEVKAEKYMPA